MRIIISPAKKMNVDTDSLPVRNLPVFLEQTEELCRELQSKSPEELQKLWKCNDRITALNVERLRQMNLRHNLTPAILAYEGIQYQYMAPGVFTHREYDYIQEHLRIVSGFSLPLKIRPLLPQRSSTRRQTVFPRALPLTLNVQRPTLALAVRH